MGEVDRDQAGQSRRRPSRSRVLQSQAGSARVPPMARPNQKNQAEPRRRKTAWQRPRRADLKECRHGSSPRTRQAPTLRSRQTELRFGSSPEASRAPDALHDDGTRPPTARKSESRSRMRHRHGRCAPTLHERDMTLPAGAADVAVRTDLEFLQDATVWAVFPHTHLRGKRWEYTLVLPSGERKTILAVPRYDFNWQTYYMFRSRCRYRRDRRSCRQRGTTTPQRTRTIQIRRST